MPEVSRGAQARYRTGFCFRECRDGHAKRERTVKVNRVNRRCLLTDTVGANYRVRGSELREALLVLRDDRSARRLEALYRNYLARVHTICRRLPAGPKAAEAASVEVYVRFSRGLRCRWDESSNLPQIRRLSNEVVLTRLLGRDGDARASGVAGLPVLHPCDVAQRKTRNARLGNAQRSLQPPAREPVRDLRASRH